MEKLTIDNFKKGFLIDDELMAGISENTNGQSKYTAYVVRHTTGETLGFQEFSDLFEAIRALNDIPREWAYEAISKCGGGNCGTGACKNGGCGKKSKSETSSCDSQGC
jgi:hypothetical protein